MFELSGACALPAQAPNRCAVLIKHADGLIGFFQDVYPSLTVNSDVTYAREFPLLAAGCDCEVECSGERRCAGAEILGGSNAVRGEAPQSDGESRK